MKNQNKNNIIIIKENWKEEKEKWTNEKSNLIQRNDKEEENKIFKL